MFRLNKTRPFRNVPMFGFPTLDARKYHPIEGRQRQSHQMLMIGISKAGKRSFLRRSSRFCPSRLGKTPKY